MLWNKYRPTAPLPWRMLLPREGLDKENLCMLELAKSYLIAIYFFACLIDMATVSALADCGIWNIFAHGLEFIFTHF